jgi:hypothetical protein
MPIPKGRNRIIKMRDETKAKPNPTGHTLTPVVPCPAFGHMMA